MDWQTGRESNYVLVNGEYRPMLTISRAKPTLADAERHQRAILRPALDRHSSP